MTVQKNGSVFPYESRHTAAHDEGQNNTDGDNCDDGKYDADNYEHANPPNFSHCDLLYSLAIVRRGCTSNFFEAVSKFSRMAIGETRARVAITFY